MQNRGATPLIVADCLLFKKVVEPWTLVVDARRDNDAEPGTALLQRGTVRSRQKSDVPRDVQLP